MASEHSIITVENLCSAITKQLHTIQLKPSLNISSRKLLSIRIGAIRIDLAN